VNIAIIASSYPRYNIDGAARFNHSIADALAKLGHNVHVIIPFSPEISPFETSVNIHNFKYICPLRFSIMGYAQAMQSDRKLRKLAFILAPLFFISAFLKLSYIVKRYDIDIIHAHWVIPNGFIASLVGIITQKPVYLSLHGSDIFFALKNRWLGLLARWTFKHIQGATTCSPELYQGAIKLGATASQLYLLPWGADPEQFSENPKGAEEVRKKYNLNSKHMVLMGIGRLVGKKGFSYLIEAVAHLLHNYDNIRLMLVGDGPEYSKLRNIAQQMKISDKVIFTGMVSWDQIPKYLAASDIFVMPSIHDKGNVDGLPTVILEAMAAGKPIIASDVGGISMVLKNGENGYLIAEKDVVALAEAITKILQLDQLEVLGKRNRKLIKEQFNWMNVARSFEAIYLGEPVPLRSALTYMDER